MTGLDLDILIASAAALSMAAWVKWALLPLIFAFAAGFKLGKLRGRQEAGRHAKTTAAR